MNESKKYDLPLFFELNPATEDILDSVLITRYGVANKKDVVLSTNAGMCYIEPGSTNWDLAIQTPQGLRASQNQPANPPKAAVPERVTVPAAWYNTQEAVQAGIEVKSGGNANVFKSDFGALLVPGGFRVPTVVATEENVQHYGLRLIPKDTAFAIQTDVHGLLLMEYEYRPTYRDDFLTQLDGGGGYFVERHNFPHLHIPLSSDCTGYILIGKGDAAGNYDFTAFRIPFGWALYTPAHTIHGDGTLIGRHAISVAHAGADVVLIYNEATKTKAEDVVPRPAAATAAAG